MNNEDFSVGTAYGQREENASHSTFILGAKNFFQKFVECRDEPEKRMETRLR